MANLLTYKQLMDVLEDIGRRHYLINTFFAGENHDLNAEQIVYPVFQVHPKVAIFPQNDGEYRTIIVSIRCRILDRMLQDGTNEIDAVNDTFRISQDIINEINQHPFYLHSNATLVGDIDVTAVNEVEDDYLAGWEFDLNIRLRNTNSFCGLPMEGIPGYSVAGPDDSNFSISWGYVTCDNITGCTNITNYVQMLIDSNPAAGSTHVGNGLNTYTGGTGTLVSVNISGGTFAGSNFSGTSVFSLLSANTISASTYYSAGTDLSTVIYRQATRIQNGINTFTGGTLQLPTVNITAATLNNLTVSGGTSLGSTSATTFYSGSTPLYNILIQQITGSSTNVNVKNGTNTYTGGTAQLLSVNISAATLDNLTVTGNTILSATSASTVSVLNSGVTLTTLTDYANNRIYSGVSLSSIVGGTGQTINAGRTNVNMIGGNNISGTTDNHTYTSNMVVTGTSMGNLYATNIFSGSTNIATLFGSGSGTATQVQPGLNTYTGGTSSLPTVNVSALTINTLTASGASTFTNTLSANTLSASTIISGSTNLYNIFAKTTDVSRVQPGTNTYTGGTATAPTVNVSALTINTLTASGATSLATVSATTIISGSTNLYNIFNTKVNSAEFAIAISDETTAITSGTSKVTFYAPYAFTITGVYASLSQSGSTNSVFDVKLTGTTIFSNATKMVVDLNTFHSSNSTFTSTITATTVPAFSKISLDIMSAGTAAAGAKIYILGTKTL